MKTDPVQSEPSPQILRRPIQARKSQWAVRTARRLAGLGLRPNHISVLSVVFGAAGAVCLLFGHRSSVVALKVVLLLAAAGCIQLRLLCNLFDGMVAIEGGFKTKSGEVFNELPDRVSDVLIFLAAAYAFPDEGWMREMGWCAALLSVLTAYVRAFGGAAGASQYFCGPMAKQQRMAVMTIACVLSAALSGYQGSIQVTAGALGLVIAGCLVTIVRRTRFIIADLESK